MSSINSADLSAHPVARPQHHLHDTSDPLPGAGGVAPTTDYGETMERASELKNTGGTTAPNYDHDHTQTKVGLGDKMVGKTQKVAGKLTHKAELVEKGELRETSGKAAGRASQD